MIRLALPFATLAALSWLLARRRRHVESDINIEVCSSDKPGSCASWDDDDAPDDIDTRDDINTKR